MLIAITGGIGCGKSVVSQLLRVMGYPVYDCDANAKRLMLTDSLLRQDLVKIFGPSAYNADGSLNKPHLSQAIFSSPELLQQMNAAVHPAVARDIYKVSGEIENLSPDNKFIGRKVNDNKHSNILFYESAILFESHFNELAIPNAVISVTAPLETRIARTMMRDNATREQVEKRINSQMSQEEKDRLADYVIKNDDRNSVIVQLDYIIPNFFCQSK